LTYNGAATNLQSPDEFVKPITLSAASMVIGKDGQRVDAVAQLDRMYREEMAALGVRVPSPLEVPENVQAA
jgi:hypothetical protein